MTIRTSPKYGRIKLSRTKIPMNISVSKMITAKIRNIKRKRFLFCFIGICYN